MCDQATSNRPSTAKEDCCVLIMFDRARTQAYINSMIMHKSIIKNYGGTCVGVGQIIHEIEGQWPHGRAMGILEFSSQEEAHRWLDSDCQVHQPDYMDRADIVIAPTKAAMRTNCWTQVMDLEITNPERFNEKYAADCLRIVESMGAQPVATTRTCNRRGIWVPNLLVINQYPNEEAFSKMYCSEEYTAIKEERLRSSRGRVVGFNLIPISDSMINKPKYCEPCPKDQCKKVNF